MKETCSTCAHLVQSYKSGACGLTGKTVSNNGSCPRYQEKAKEKKGHGIFSVRK